MRSSSQGLKPVSRNIESEWSAELNGPQETVDLQLEVGLRYRVLKGGSEHTARGIAQACGSPYTRNTRLCNRGSVIPMSKRAIHGLWFLSACKQAYLAYHTSVSRGSRTRICFLAHVVIHNFTLASFMFVDFIKSAIFCAHQHTTRPARSRHNLSPRL